MTEKVREADAHSPTRWATGRITSLQPVDVRLGCGLSLIHISEPTRRTPISYAVFCLKKKKLSKGRRCSAAVEVSPQKKR